MREPLAFQKKVVSYLLCPLANNTTICKYAHKSSFCIKSSAFINLFSDVFLHIQKYFTNMSIIAYEKLALYIEDYCISSTDDNNMAQSFLDSVIQNGYM